MKFRTTVACVATVATLTLAGCGSEEDSTATPDDGPTTTAPATTTPDTGTTPPPADSEEPAAQAVTITIEDFTYSDPGPVAPGAEITVENLDQASHTVTADGAGGFDVTIKPGESATFTAPSEPGEYPYLCTFHPAMTATLVVAG